MTTIKNLGTSRYILIPFALFMIIALTITLIIVLKQKQEFKGAAVTNGLECSAIARNIMVRGGTVADAAIGALFCEGVTMPHAMGLGGGFLLTMYNQTTREAVSLNSREIAYAAATEDMFVSNPSLSQEGGLAIAVPGELRGYWELYQKYGGGVSWKDLVQPSIDICNNGFTVSEYIANLLQSNREKILANQMLSNIFVKNNSTELYAKGDIIYRKRLGKTLEIIAEEGGHAMHNGSLTNQLINDIQMNNGQLTKEDLNSYRPQWQTPNKVFLNDSRIYYSQPLPGSGAVLSFILNILDTYLDLQNVSSIDNYQKIVESFKYGFAQRTLLGDFEGVNQTVNKLLSKEFSENIRSLINLNSTSQNASQYGANNILPEDHGTANLCFLAPNGDAIVVTSTINTNFGSGVVSESTGILLNNQMDDFSSPNMANAYGFAPSPFNFIKPGRRPLSSMSPTIVVDQNGDVEMLVGAAGGSKILTGIAQIIIRHLWYGSTLQEASDFKRLHHQLIPMKLVLERSFETEDTEIYESLKKIGHDITFEDAEGFHAATSISKRKGEAVVGVWDSRRSGGVSYL